MTAARPVGFLDTSVVVRYLTGDPPEMADRAAALIDAGAELVLSELVLVETAYVLESFYEIEREPLTEALGDLVRRRNLKLLGLPKNIVLEALALCRGSRRVSFADALLWAQAVHADTPRVYSFARRFPGEGIELPKV
jgi:predicted nucleic-acid-binding protein